ncbi:MAG: hypothetical protein ACR2G0_04980 [Chthoniobacterales bacterium]
MIKLLVALIACLLLWSSCAAPPRTGGPPGSVASSSSNAAATVDTTSTEDEDDYETIFVPPPAGSLLGGGSVRVPRRTIAGSDEKALLGNIRRLNAAAGSPRERPFVISSVSRVTGVSEQELQRQQDRMQLRFGELCAINAIARGKRARISEIASLRANGQTWTSLARANGISIATVAQTARSASEMTANAFTNYAERQKSGDRKYHELNVYPQRQHPNG